jgi:uncharacterized protein involved in outer membrane biogenesis
MRARRWRGLLRWSGWLLLAIVVLAAVALLAAPRLLDVPAVRAKLERTLSDAAGGRLTWDALDVRLLPTPRATIRGATAQIPGAVDARIEEAQVDLRLLALLAGRVELQHVRIVHAVVRVAVQASTDSAPAPRVDPITAYRNAVQPVADAVRRLAPSLSLSLEDATLHVSVPGLPDVVQVNLNAQGRTSAQGIALTATAAGKLWERIGLKAQLDYADLAAHVEAEGAGLKPQTLIDHYLAGAVVGLTLPQSSARAKLDTDGRKVFSAQLITDVPALTLMRDGAQVELQAVHIEADAKSSGADLEVQLKALRLGELVPAASGVLRVVSATGGKAEATLDVPALDLERLRALATTLAGNEPIVKGYLSRIRGGRVSDLHVSAQAASMDGLTDMKAIDVRLTLAGGAMLVPYVEQLVDEIGGEAALSAGVIRAKGVAGRLAQTRIANGTFEYDLSNEHMRIGSAFSLDLAQGVEVTRRLLSPSDRAQLDVLHTVSGRAEGQAAIALTPRDWKVNVAVTRSDSRVVVRGLPWPVSVREGQVTVTPTRVSVDGAAGALGTSTFRGAGAELVTAGRLRIDAAHGFATVALAPLLAWLREQEGLSDQLAPLQSVAGTAEVTLKRLSGRPDQPDTLNFDASVSPRQARVQLAGLPEPVQLDGGTLSVTPRTLRVDAVGAALLDARARVSASIADLRAKPLKVEASATDGAAGGQLITWVWERTQAPPRLLPKAATRFAVQRLTWSASGPIDVQASAALADGPALEADLSWEPESLNVRSLRIEDAESKATLRLAMRGRMLDWKFNGVLTGRSVASIFARVSGEHPGKLEGDFSATIDRDLRGRSTAHGRLTGQVLHLDALLGRPLRIPRIDIDASGDLVRINQATVEYEQQRATLRGQIRNGAAGPKIDADIDTPGIDIDALLPPAQHDEATAPTPKKKTPQALDIWPLAFEGTLRLRAGFLEYERRRVEPVIATLTLEPERVRLEAAQAMLCGVAFPFTAEITPRDIGVSGRVEAKQQQLATTARCLTEENVLLTGTFDLNATLHTRGKRDELLQNLQGLVDVHARDGKVMKFGLLGNILSAKSVTSVLKGQVNFGDQGFDYRSITLRGKIGDGQFRVVEGAFDSAAVGLAATGTVRLKDYNGNLTVLVAPFTTIDRITRSIPIIGYILGGALTSIAVGVTGDIRNPTVVPLDPRAITSELVGIFQRTLKLPSKLLEPLQRSATPAQPPR